MITKQQAIALGNGTLREDIHCELMRRCMRIIGPRGSITNVVIKVRPNGRCQTWKRDNNRFRLPVKHGLYAYGEITHLNCASFHLASECPADIK